MKSDVETKPKKARGKEETKRRTKGIQRPWQIGWLSIKNKRVKGSRVIEMNVGMYGVGMCLKTGKLPLKGDECA